METSSHNRTYIKRLCTPSPSLSLPIQLEMPTHRFPTRQPNPPPTETKGALPARGRRSPRPAGGARRPSRAPARSSARRTSMTWKGQRGSQNRASSLLVFKIAPMRTRHETNKRCVSCIKVRTFSVHERWRRGRRVARWKVDPEKYSEHCLVWRHQQRRRDFADSPRLAQVFDLEDARVLEYIQIVELLPQRALWTFQAFRRTLTFGLIVQRSLS